MKQAAAGGKTSRRPYFILAVLFLLLLALFAYACPGVGRYANDRAMSYRVLADSASGKLPDWWTAESRERFVSSAELSPEEDLLKTLAIYMIPRALGAILVGASLAASGAVYQGLFRNPLLSPDLLGASMGAAFGGALAIVMNWSGLTSLLSAFLMGVAAVAVVYLISLTSIEDQMLTMLLGGILVSSLFRAGISILKVFVPSDEVLPSLTAWLMGGISPGFRSDQLRYIILPVLVGLSGLMLLRWRLNLATLGDDEAKSMGVGTFALRGASILLSTLVTAACVAVCGDIGWIGLVVPHIARRLLGPDFRVMLPGSMILGGILLLLVDMLSQQFNPVIPAGALTGFIGVPFYLYLLIDRRKQP